MEGAVLSRTGFRRAVAACQHPAKRRVAQQPRRFFATPTDAQGRDEITPAPEVRLTNDPDQFSRSSTHADTPSAPSASRARGQSNRNTVANGRQYRPRDGGGGSGTGSAPDLRRLRIAPASPSYFTATPKYTDDLLMLSALHRRHQLLPILPPGQAPRVAWKTIDQYKTELAEPVRAKMYGVLVQLLKRLNYIHPSLLPEEVATALQGFKREVQPHLNVPKPVPVSQYGVAVAVGRRKSASATVHLVEGTGEVVINGKSLSEYFGRLHDRESCVWALKATARLDKYNMWVVTDGGGTTGQAEAIMLGVGRALLALEPDLKMAVRRAGAITRNPKRVERKKPGKLKARKMPTWVKR
ncbi:hypothetical protein B0A50_04775 [Salinomyces thailandicus]|uniref:Small ribosomal subunit protein uS9m n=1 Tax=Salinomyces thailandicus TaxID=706561 RepID=A0A4U0TWI3_9PEZI|nr:hypothetical protein B0A50_04775 [Salinomyces thailandica]